jgi:antitoxin YefM
MYTTFHLKASELNEEFLKKLKTLFKGKNISLSVEEDMDETEYLLSTEANRKHLMEAIENVEKGNLVKISGEDWKKYRKSKNFKDLNIKKVSGK